MAEAPGPGVLAAFGVGEAEPVALTGGQGRAWLAGEVVLKPVDDEVEAAWIAGVLAELPEDGFRVSRPVPGASGSWVDEGWAAWTVVEGSHDFRTERHPEVLDVARAFHRALQGIPAPQFFDARTDPWSVGDRVAWGEAPLVARNETVQPLLDRLGSGLRRIDLPRQVIHGDPCANVLFAPGLAPAVIDFSPCHRPAAWALAIIVSDAVAWWSASSSILDHVDDVVDFAQLVRRAAIYRVVTADLLTADRTDYDLDKELRDFVRVADLIDLMER